MNIGSAVRSHEFDACQIEVASAMPGRRRELVSTIATRPMAASASAIQTPEREDREQQER